MANARWFFVTATLLVGNARAGPLDPPIGPVAGSNKTLKEVEPRVAISAANTPGDAGSLYRIEQPGSYYLTGNVQAVAEKHGIVIAASGVTIDLNGFELLGFVGMTAVDGITTDTTGLSNLTVRNGSIRDWRGDGIDFDTNFSWGCTVEDVHSSDHDGRGIAVDLGSIVSSCTVYNTVKTGIQCDLGSAVSGCTVFSCDDDGIVTGKGCRVTDCVVSVGDAWAIVTGSACIVSGCVSNNNELGGIWVQGKCVVRDNKVGHNEVVGSGTGILASGAGNRIEGNACDSGDTGIEVDGDENIIVRNSCYRNGVNWVIAANNYHGPIIDRTTATTPPVSGNSATDALGTSHPWANISH